MKCIVIGDLSLPTPYIVKQFESLEKYGIQIVPMNWEPKISRQEFMKKIKNIEENGPNAEQPPRELLEQMEDANFLVVHFAPVPASIIYAGKELKIIGCLRGGMENIDTSAASKGNILVLNSSSRNADAVADYTFGLLLSEVRNIVRASFLLIKGDLRAWEGDFKEFLGSDLAGKTIGIIGFGNIGKEVARRAKGFKMKTIAYDPYVPEEEIKKYEVEPTKLEILLRMSDFVTIHTRLNEETRKLIGEREIALMKPTSYLINTARGGIVDEKALYEALKEHRIGGAALDVYEEEPLHPRSPLLGLDNITLTPHIAGVTREAIYVNSPRIMVNKIERLLEGSYP